MSCEQLITIVVNAFAWIIQVEKKKLRCQSQRFD